MGPPLTPLLPHLGQDVVQRHIAKQLLTFFRVVAIAQRELIDKTQRIDDTDLSAQHPNRLLGGSGQWFGLECHLSTSSVKYSTTRRAK
jgi:hypothetical protein